MNALHLTLEKLTPETLVARCSQWQVFPQPQQLVMFTPSQGDSFFGLITEVVPHEKEANHLALKLIPVWGYPSLPLQNSQVVPAAVLFGHIAKQNPPQHTLVLNQTPFDLDTLGKGVFLKPDSLPLLRTVLEGLGQLPSPLVIIDPVGLNLPLDTVQYQCFGEDVSLSMQDIGVSTCLSWIAQQLPPAIQAEATQALFRLIPPTADFIPVAYFTDHPALAEHPLASSILHQFYQFHRYGLWATTPAMALTPQHLEAGIHLDLSRLPGNMMPYAYEGLLRFIRHTALQSALQLVLVAPESSVTLTHSLIQEDRHRLVLVSPHDTQWADWITDRLFETERFGERGIYVEGAMSRHLPLFLPNTSRNEPLSSGPVLSPEATPESSTLYEETDANHWVQYNEEDGELHWNLDAFEVPEGIEQPMLTWHHELEEATAPEESATDREDHTPWALEPVDPDALLLALPLDEASEFEPTEEAPPATPLFSEDLADDDNADLLSEIQQDEIEAVLPFVEPTPQTEPDWLGEELLFTVDAGPILDPSLPPTLPEPEAEPLLEAVHLASEATTAAPAIDPLWLNDEIHLDFNLESGALEPEAEVRQTSRGEESETEDLDLWLTSTPSMAMEDSDESAYRRDMHADEDNPLPHLGLQSDEDDIPPPPFMDDDSFADNAGLLGDLFETTPETLAEEPLPTVAAPLESPALEIDYLDNLLGETEPVVAPEAATIEVEEPLPNSLDESPVPSLEPLAPQIDEDGWPTMAFLEEEDTEAGEAADEDDMLPMASLWDDVVIVDAKPVEPSPAISFEAEALPIQPVSPLALEDEDTEDALAPLTLEPLVLEPEALAPPPPATETHLPEPALAVETEDLMWTPQNADALEIIEAPEAISPPAVPSIDSLPFPPAEESISEAFSMDVDLSDFLDLGPLTLDEVEEQPAIAAPLETLAVEEEEQAPAPPEPVFEAPEPTMSEGTSAHPDPLDFIFGEAEPDLGLNFQLDFEEATPVESILAGPPEPISEPTLPPPVPQHMLDDMAPSFSLMDDLEALEGPSPEVAVPTPVPVVKAVPASGKVPLYQPGQIVRHHRYGQGVIKRVITMNDEQVILNINFEGIGKRLLDPRLTQLEKVS